MTRKGLRFNFPRYFYQTAVWFHFKALKRMCWWTRSLWVSSLQIIIFIYFENLFRLWVLLWASPYLTEWAASSPLEISRLYGLKGHRAREPTCGLCALGTALVSFRNVADWYLHIRTVNLPVIVHWVGILYKCIYVHILCDCILISRSILSACKILPHFLQFQVTFFPLHHNYNHLCVTAF